MIYLRSNKATDWEQPSFFGKLLRPILKSLTANPDYEMAFPDIAEWLIEFDEDEMPNREIALDKEGVPIVAGPNERNYGFWLDTNLKLNDFENKVIERNYFESKWKEFHGKET